MSDKILFISDELNSRNVVLYNRLVPARGNADTLEGEIIRAINRILYCFYNDGDYWYERAGVETAGPAVEFLRRRCPVDVRKELESSEGKKDQEYERPLHVVLEKIISYVEGQKEMQPSSIDMLSFTLRRNSNRPSVDSYL